jgi:hypothetical protein
MEKLAVLARHKETDDTWLNIIKENDYEVVVYNKYFGENLLDNVGREGHTYIKYILDNYKNLPDEILFSQYDAMDHINKRPGYKKEFFFNSKLLDFIGINSTDFDLDVVGRKINWFGLSKVVFDNFSEEELYKLVATGSTLNGIFRTTKDSISRFPIETYERCLDLLSRSSKPMESYYFERIWKYMFMRTGNFSGRHGHFNNRIFLLGTKDKSPDMPNARKKFVRMHNNYGHIKLFDDGTICSNNNVSYYTSQRESHWKIEDEWLHLMDSCGGATSRYWIKEDRQEFCGDFWNTETKSWEEQKMMLSPPMWIDHFI